MKEVTFILLSLIITSCASDTYVLNKFRNVEFATVVGYRATNPLSVYPIADDALRVEENSTTGIRKLESLQNEKSFLLKLVNGNTVTIIERTSPLEENKLIGLKMEFSANGYKLYENGKEIGSNNKLRMKVGETHLFRILQDGDWTKAIMDCDTIANIKTSIPASEYTIFSTGNDTEIEIYSFDVIDLYNSRDNFVEMWKKN